MLRMNVELLIELFNLFLMKWYDVPETFLHLYSFKSHELLSAGVCPTAHTYNVWKEAESSFKRH